MSPPGDMLPPDEHPADSYLSEAFIKSLHGRVVTMEGDLARNTESTIENTASIGRVEANTKDIVDTFAALNGGFKVLSAIGKMAKPIWYIAAAGAAIVTLWAAIKGIITK